MIRQTDIPPDGIANIAHSPEDLRAKVTAFNSQTRSLKPPVAPSFRAVCLSAGHGQPYCFNFSHAYDGGLAEEASGQPSTAKPRRTGSHHRPILTIAVR